MYTYLDPDVDVEMPLLSGVGLGRWAVTGATDIYRQQDLSISPSAELGFKFVTDLVHCWSLVRWGLSNL